MHKDYVISELPEKCGEGNNPLKDALKKLILEKPDVLPGCRLADEIREEIANKKQEEANDD